jgi:hypothetical protein
VGVLVQPRSHGLPFVAGGVDTDVLRWGKEAIRREIDEKIVPLLPEGGFIPQADGRVREVVPFENYEFYRRHLEEVAGV